MQELFTFPSSFEWDSEDDGSFDKSCSSFDEGRTEFELSEETDRDELNHTCETFEDPESNGNVEPDGESRNIYEKATVRIYGS